MIVRRKLHALKEDLTERFGEDTSNKALAGLTDAMESLGQYAEKGVAISKLYNVETDYYYLFSTHNYIVYRFDSKEVVILEMFNERQDYMNTLFGISGRTQESIDYWGE